ncbi:bacteriohemerythrin [Desulfomicrobium salsuginis]
MTAKITWDSSFETGISAVDAQHLRLVEIINSLVDAIGHADKNTLKGIVEQLKEYAQYHFRTEEKIMAESNYAGLAEHRDEHAMFVDQILLFDLDVILASEGLAWDMLHFLRGWLTNHILVVDKRFSTQLQA